MWCMCGLTFMMLGLSALAVKFDTILVGFNPPSAYYNRLHETARATIATNMTGPWSKHLNTSEDVLTMLADLTARASQGNRVAYIGRCLKSWSKEACQKAARAGVVLFLYNHFPDWTADGLHENNSLVYSIHVDMKSGVEAMGSEWCRLSKRKPQKVLMMTGPSASSNTMRVTEPPVIFERVCGVSADPVKILNVSMSSVEESVFSAALADGSITAVLCWSDTCSLNAMKGLDKALGEARARKVFVSGWDNRPEIQEALKQNRIFATVDQSVKYPNKGVWAGLRSLIELIENQHLNTTWQVARALGLTGPDKTLRTPVFLVPADKGGYLESELLSAYSPTQIAMQKHAGPASVKAHVEDLAVDAYDVGGGSFDSTFWMRLQWLDERLTWESEMYNDSIELPIESIWHPTVFFQTSTKQTIIFSSKARVYPSGEVEWSQHIAATFTCEMYPESFPFDVHTCSIVVGTTEVPDKVELTSSSFGVSGVPSDFAVDGHVASATDNRLFFEVTAKHLPDFVLICYMAPAYLLNLISLGSFYLPGTDDRTGLGVTAVLAQMVLQTEARVAKVTTWLDMFLNLCLAFQVLAFGSTLLARRAAAASTDEDAGVATILHIKWSLEWYADAVLGCDKDLAVDRLSRRYLVPVFLIVNIVICFYPNSGKGDITKHPSHGAQMWLFWVNIGLLILFGGACGAWTATYSSCARPSKAISETPASTAEELPQQGRANI